MKDRDEEFYGWLLDNEGKPEAESALQKIYASSAGGSGQEASEAFSSFAAKTGLEPRRRWGSFGRNAVRLVAVLALPLCLLSAWALSRALAPAPEWIQAATSYSETRVIAFSDGSTALLGPCSQVFYPSEFRGRQRKLILVGEAFMEVAKDRRRQFVVSTGNMDVIVHGTRFNVCAFPDNEEDEVALVEGSVEMSFPGRESSIFLSPGELVKYDRESGAVQRRSFSANYFEEVMSQGGLQFRDAPLSDIISDLTRRFNVNIVIVDTSLATERYYASFINGEDVETILQALNTGSHFRVSNREGVYYISK